MTDSRFEELISLYLDQEISVQDKRKLKALLHRSPEHRARFDEQCRLFYAEKVVFHPESNKQIAREIAILRGKILEGVKTTRNGRGRYRVRQFSPGAFAALAAAVVAIIALGHNVLNGPLGQSDFSKGLASMHNYMADQGQEARKTLAMNPGVGAPVSASEQVHVQSPLSTSLNLSGLSNAGSANLALAELDAPWQSILDQAQEETPKKRLVLVVPRNALPQPSTMGPAPYTLPVSFSRTPSLNGSGQLKLQTKASY